MGRLFWKFFIFIWLVQMAGMIAVGTAFWMKREAEIQQLEQFQAAGREPPPRLLRHLDRPRGPRIPLLPLTGTLIASLVAAALLARYFSRPIRQLRDAFDAAAAGNLQVRIGARMGRRRDELADLGHDFDRMAERLGILMDSQRRLLHDVSHELRSPLARLQAAIGLAHQQPEKLQATLERIELESARIDSLVGELLTLSRLETGHGGRFDTEIDLDELLAEIIDNARFEAELRGQQVDYDRGAGGRLPGNPELLYRAIENVVRNALKHSPENGLITLRSTLSGNAFRLSVLDQGPGIDTQEIDQIFQPFFRGSGAGQAGYGLGLAIARRALEAHHGSICATNRDGGGLCVEITLPLTLAA